MLFCPLCWVHLYVYEDSRLNYMYVCSVFFFVCLVFFGLCLWKWNIVETYSWNKRLITGITPASPPLTRLHSFMLASLVYHMVLVRQKCTNYPVAASILLMGWTGTFHLWLTWKSQHSEKLGIKIVLKKVSFILKRTETRKKKTEWAEWNRPLYRTKPGFGAGVRLSVLHLQTGETDTH